MCVAVRLGPVGLFPAKNLNNLQKTSDTRAHLSLKEALRSRICAQWLMEAWTYSLHPREDEPPRPFLTPEDDSG